MNNRFTGIWPALATPFRNGEVDIPALQRLVHRFMAAGVSGLVVCGTTGEAASLDADERLSVLDAVMDAVVDCRAGFPIVMGLAGNHIKTVLSELEAVQRRSVAGILIPPPYYIRPSQQGIADFYRAIAAAASVPLILYNIPYRTGVSIELDTIREIALHPAVRAIKDCGGDPALTMQLIADGRLDVLAGEDLQIFSTLCLGGAGAISAASHLRPDLFVRMAALIDAGSLEAARRIFYSLRPAIEAIFAEPNPGPLKAALAELGLIENEVRPPMRAATIEAVASVTKQARTLAGLMFE